MLTRTRGYASSEPQNNNSQNKSLLVVSNSETKRKSSSSSQYHYLSPWNTTTSPSPEPLHTQRPLSPMMAPRSTSPSSSSGGGSRVSNPSPNHYPPPPPVPPPLPVYPHPPPSLPRDPTFPESEPHKPLPPTLPKQNVTCQFWLPKDVCLKVAYCSVFSSLIGLFMIFTIIFSGIFQPIQGSKKVSPNQTVKVSVDTTLCKGIEVKGDIDSVGLFVQDPPLNKTIVDNFGRFTSLPGGKYTVWNWELNQGSKINISSCTNDTSTATLLVFEGETNYNQWIDRPQEENVTNSLYQCTIDGNCSNEDYYNLELAVSHTDTYYFVFYNPAEEATSISTIFEMQRLEYDTSNPLQHCDTSPCSLYFSYNSNQFVIVNMKDSDYADDPMDLSWKCLPLPIYFGLFLSVTSLCCLLPLWLYLCCYWPLAGWTYCKKRWKYGENFDDIQALYEKETQQHQEAERNYEILKPAYESARIHWYAAQFAHEKEKIMKEYTEKCIQYDQDKALWTQTVFVTEKDKLMREYEISLKTWMELYGTSSKPSSYPHSSSSSSLNTPLLGGGGSGYRSISVPVAFTINERVGNYEEMS